MRLDDSIAVLGTTKNGRARSLPLVSDVRVALADATKVRQSLFNLLSNACKFTEHGTVSLTVARETGQGADLILLSVTDTGMGIAPDQLGKLFEPFTQAGPIALRKFGGTGLGLAITRRFCQLMGGDVNVASEPGKGSTFSIRLPADVHDPRVS